MSATPIKCVVIDDDDVSRRIIEKFIEKADGLELLASFSSGEDAASLLNQSDVGLLFLDVEMPEVSGLDLVRHLSHRPPIILITAKKEYALDAFELDVADFLLKPFTYLRFLKAVAKVQELQKQTDPAASHPVAEVFFVKHNSRYVRVLTNEIVWIEAIGDYVELHTKDKKYTAHITMKALEQKLPVNTFARVHRSYIVNLTSIQEIEDNTLSVGKKLIPIGKSYRDALLKALNTI
jgi:DNA-binding LytR/AlgR family response regulator